MPVTELTRVPVLLSCNRNVAVGSDRPNIATGVEVPTIEVRRTGGTERDLQAQRVAATRDHTCFERRTGEEWVTLLELPSDAIREARRRVIETNGSFRWVTAQSVRQGVPR